MKTSLLQLAGSLRQCLQPAEFRIPVPAWPADWEASLRQLATAEIQEAKPTPADVDLVKRQREERDRQKFLAEMATNLWRLRKRMLESDGKSPKEPFRREYRHVESLWDSLTQAGVEIRDPQGMKFDMGLQMTVLAYQPSPGVTHERVHETQKPGILLHGTLIQMAEVIVETPMKPPNSPEASHPGSEAPTDPTHPAEGTSAELPAGAPPKTTH